jgi:predicted amidohydrolase
MASMKLCVVQTRPVKGDVPRNIARHLELVALAAAKGAGMVVFPELSLTGYEPTLAKELAMGPDDRRLDVFQVASDEREITIGVGVPTTCGAGVAITMVLFGPGEPRRTYSKKYLHADEEPFFVSGENFASFEVCGTRIAPAICYELSVAAHAEAAAASGAEIYLASVAKSASGVDQASRRLADIAMQYSMTVLMANSVGPCDNFESAGRSAIWNRDRALMGQLDDASEGILILDTATGEVVDEGWLADGNREWYA